jgi:hypothetical protein
LSKPIANSIGLRCLAGDSDSFYSGKTMRAGYLSIFTAKDAKAAKERRLTAENAEGMKT